LNRRTAEQGTAEYRSEEYCLIPYSIFDIQNEKHAKAIRLKGEGFKPSEWKNKCFGYDFPFLPIYLTGQAGHSNRVNICLRY